MIVEDSVRHAESTNLMRSMPQRMVRTKGADDAFPRFLGRDSRAEGTRDETAPDENPAEVGLDVAEFGDDHNRQKDGQAIMRLHITESKGKEPTRMDKGEDSGADAVKGCLSAQLSDVVDLSLEKEETNVVKPSICSLNSGFMDAPMASNTKSIPSRLANFAAGTKSLSPAMRTILSTCFFSAIETMSMPIRVSMPFCFIDSVKSNSSKFSIVFFPLNKAFVAS